MRKLICIVPAFLLLFASLTGCREKCSNVEQVGLQTEITDAMRQQIHAYFHYSGEDSENMIAGYRYYGTYQGYVILMDAGLDATIDEVVIGGRIFRWGSGKLRILAYKDGQAQPLQEVYAAGKISVDDLDQIIGVHKAYFATLHKWEYGDSVLPE